MPFEIIDEGMSALVTKKRRTPGQLIKFGKFTSANNKNSNQLIEDKTQDIQELMQLKEELEKRKKSEEVLETLFKNTISSVMTFVHNDGTKFSVEVTSALFKDNKGHRLFVRDITESKEKEEALRLSEEKFAKAFHNSQSMMSITRLSDNKIIQVNNTFTEMFGYNSEEFMGKSSLELNIWANPKERQEMLTRLSEDGFVNNFDVTLRNKSGRIFFALMAVNVLDVGDEKFLLTSSIDITDRKQAEEALRSSEELFSKTFNANPLSMSVLSIEHTFMEVNETFLKRNGYTREELIGFTANDINFWVDSSEYLKYLEEIEKIGSINNFEVRVRRKSGEIATVLLSGVIVSWKGEECILAIDSDITELRRYQHEIARLDRLELVGEMAALISHEIRTPLTTVRDFLQLHRGKGRYVQDKEYMDLMIDELDRANSIITELVSLSKNKAVELKRRSLNNKLNNLFPLLQVAALKQNKIIEMELGNIPYIVIDESEIKQLILNLVRNGLEAMAPGGFLTIKTFKDDNGVTLTVQDQGKGIAPDVLEKIGTPFFTTKDNGTGLGLAVCYSIAQRNNAKIDIETGSNGTTFYVRFKV